MVIHRAADVEQQQHLHGVAALGAHPQVQRAGVAGRGANGAIDIQLIRGPLAGEAAQATQGELHRA